MINNATEQRTIAWFRERFSNITGSRVSDLMSKGRSKDNMWSLSAMSYIYQLAAERAFNPDFLNDDDVFQSYLDLTQLHSKAVEWGTEQEDSARDLYKTLYQPDKEIIQVGLCTHDTIPHFAASPDGLVRNFDDQGGMLALEIKCPATGTFMKYVREVKDAETLKKVKPEYYWQIQAEMDCTGAEAADFIVYCPWLTNPLFVKRIERDGAAIKEMEERVIAANKEIDNITNPR